MFVILRTLRNCSNYTAILFAHRITRKHFFFTIFFLIDTQSMLENMFLPHSRKDETAMTWNVWTIIRVNGLSI